VRNLNSLQQEEIEKELLQLEDAVFKFFADNNIVGNSDKLSNLIEAFANKGGYF
jgi:hypothetical protein